MVVYLSGVPFYQIWYSSYQWPPDNCRRATGWKNRWHPSQSNRRKHKQRMVRKVLCDAYKAALSGYSAPSNNAHRSRRNQFRSGRRQSDQCGDNEYRNTPLDNSQKPATPIYRRMANDMRKQCVHAGGKHPQNRIKVCVLLPTQ